MKKVAMIAAVGIAAASLAGCKDEQLVKFFGTADRCVIVANGNTMVLSFIDAAKIKVKPSEMKTYSAAYKAVKAACDAGSNLKSTPNAAQLFNAFMAAAGEIRS